MAQGLTDNAYTDKQILHKYQTLPIDEDKVKVNVLINLPIEVFLYSI